MTTLLLGDSLSFEVDYLGEVDQLAIVVQFLSGKRQLLPDVSIHVDLRALPL